MAVKSAHAVRREAFTPAQRPELFTSLALPVQRLPTAFRPPLVVADIFGRVDGVGALDDVGFLV